MECLGNTRGVETVDFLCVSNMDHDTIIWKGEYGSEVAFFNQKKYVTLEFKLYN